MKLNKLITLSLLTSSLLISAEIQDINSEAMQYLQSNVSSKAYTLLEKEYKKGNYDNQSLFLLGTSAKLQKDYSNAIKYFEQLLKRDKGAHRVRLDLASVYYYTGKLQKAKELLLIVKRSNPPKKVGDNIDSFLAAIEKGVPKSWSISFNVGYQYDSNVNAGPDTDTVLMYNLPFTLSDDAKVNSDHAIKYGVNFNYLKHINGFGWQSSLGANVIDYRKFHNLDNKSISLSIGITGKKNRITYSIPFIANVSIIGHENRYYSIAKGISPQVSYQLEQDLLLSGSLSLQNKKYYKQKDKESNSITFSPFIRKYIDQSSFVNFGGYLGQENSHTQTSSNNSKGLNLGYYKAFSQKFNIYLGASYSKTDYDGEEVAYNQARKDSSKSVNVNFNYFVDTIKSNIGLNMSYTKNSSSIEIYDYDRKVFGINLSRNF